MGEIDELRAILALPEDDSAEPEPANGQPQVRADADDDAAVEEDADEAPLSPEELVAEAVRQDAEELGEEAEEAAAADASEPGADEDPELAELREKARLYDEQQLRAAEEQLTAQQTALENEIRARVLAARQHYAAEEARLLDQLDADAENTPNPAAYKRAHRQAIITSVREHEAAWIAQIEADYTTRATALFHERNKPLFAQHLIEHHNLPDDPRLKAELLRVSDINRMPERAEELARMYEQFKAMQRAAQQAQAEAKAKDVKQSQPHPSSVTSRPRRRKPVEYTGSKEELKAILALR